ncbi:hypothetical protein I6N96_09910 [Enterococcus sp. BWM-S5]|uniref:Uncharacterized protein n=1 Tax=Enterococcus larvae TaxID=2794352 RepID=A0ABS4CK01_9ENTE|nr:hypothetical protein [Enterococcus larvae]MBP1046602.1 hypothetical protein [Enterococcus larvae]
MLRMKHVLLEVYFDDERVKLEEVLTHTSNLEELMYKEVKFTYADNELAYAGQKGIVYNIEDMAGFGGDMEIEPEEENYEAKMEKLIEAWQEIAVRKIDEAVNEYMAVKDSILAEFDKEN